MKTKILFLSLLTFSTWAIASGDNGGGGSSGGNNAPAPASPNANYPGNPNSLQNPAYPNYTNNPINTNYPFGPNIPTNGWVNPTNSIIPTNPPPIDPSNPNRPLNPANPNNPTNTYTRDNPNNPNNPYTMNNPNSPNNPYTRNNPNNFTNANNGGLGMTNGSPYSNFTNRDTYVKPYTVDPRTMGNGNAGTNH